MNIFATDDCPIKSAQNLDDLRIPKMILESCQMISFGLWIKKCSWTDSSFVDEDFTYYKGKGFPYGSHPCTLWSLRSKPNYLWLLDHATTMCQLYSRVSKRQHACEPLLKHAYKFQDCFDEAIEHDPFKNCTELKSVIWNNLSVVQKYRLQMIIKWRKQKFVSWEYGSKPYWFEEFSELYEQKKEWLEHGN